MSGAHTPDDVIGTGSGDRARPYARGLAEIATGRRTLLRAGAGAFAFSAVAGALGGPASAAGAASSPLRAYVLVLDGLRPEEIDSGLMPTVKALRDGGLSFPRAQSQPVMETIPNHVMMMTGVRPDRSGVPANSIWDPVDRAVRDMDRATDIKAPTVIEQLNAAGLRTATVLSKEYLYGVFGSRATHRWEPFPVLPVTGHAPDVSTMPAALTLISRYDPHLAFINLGDIDRVGHGDLSGTTLQAARRAALISADRQVSSLVDLLTSSGRWRNSLLVVLADHSMDWSRPDRVVSLSGALDADPLLTGKVQIADNGGADLLYWTGAATDRQRAVSRMAAIATATPGVLSVHRPAALRLGARAGDLVAYARAGWRFSDPDGLTSNPIPGNHGHPATKPIPFFVAGGHSSVPRAGHSSLAASTLDVAPTIGRYFGLRPPRSGWEGVARI